MESTSTIPLSNRSPRVCSGLFIQTLSTKISRPQMVGMDIADVKLHSLTPSISVMETPSSPASVSSSGSFSSISSAASNYKAIYPPASLDRVESMDSLTNGNQTRSQRLGSIDQLVEWSRNATEDPSQPFVIDSSTIPTSGSECPMLAKIPSKIMNICGYAWNRVHQRMSLQLLCQGVENDSLMGLYEIKSGAGRGALVAAIILYPRHLSKAFALEKRMLQIADQEWKDMPPVRVWWVNELPGKSISAPISSSDSISWSPISFQDYRSYSDGIQIVDAVAWMDEDLPGARDSRSSRSSPGLRPNFPRRKSSYPLRSPEEQSPTSVKSDMLLTDELDVKLSKLILSDG